MAAIFLVGARAAGKTTVGLELARLLEQLGQTDAANQHYRAAVAAHNTH